MKQRFIGFLLFFAATISRLPAADAPQDNGQSKLIMHRITPSDTDSRIDKFSGEEWMHIAYFNPSMPDKGLLVVWLPGTGGKPGARKSFFQFAADEGFHVVSLAYPDNLSISHFHNSDDPDAFKKARENVIYGKIPFAKLNTGVPNSIESRLHFLLVYLDKTYPQENWRQFFLKGKGEHFDYEKLILAGSSQGGGHAAFMAYEHKVARVLMFGAPKDFNVHFNQPAKWFSDPNATPLDRFFSFVHDKDEGHGCTYAQQLENYRAMKLSPAYPVINVDNSKPPYEHTRLLTSDRPSFFPHGAPSAYASYSDAWKYLLTEPVE